MTRLVRWVAARSRGHLWCGSLCESGSAARQRRGPASQKPLRFGVGSGIHMGVRVSGPMRTGSGPRGHAGLCPSAGWTDYLRHRSQGTSPPPTAGVPRGFRGRLPSVPAPAGHLQARLRPSRSVGLTPRPAWALSPTAPSKLQQHLSCAPACPGSNLALGLGTKPKQHLDDRCAYRQALPRPTGLDNVPPGLSFPTCYRALLDLQDRQAPLHSQAASWAQEDSGGPSQLPRSPPRDAPEGPLVSGTREASRASNGQV